MKQKQLTLDMDQALDVLAAIDTQNSFRESYYETDCLTDYSQKPYQLFVFLRVFEVRRTKAGKLIFYSGRVVKELSGKTRTAVANKLELLLSECEGSVPAAQASTRTWIPEKWQNIRKALKVFNLLGK